MNKILFFILFLTFNAAFAADGSETVIMLISKTSRGQVISKDIVIAGSGFLMVNAEKLSPDEIITQSPHIKNISTFLQNKVIPLQGCDHGTFQHILKNRALKKEETGCLNSERYLQLKNSFRALKKDPFKR